MLQTLIECAKPTASVPPWLFTTGLCKPINIAPLYFLGSSLFLNLLREKYEKISENMFNDFFKFLVMKFAVPSAVLIAMFFGFLVNEVIRKINA